MQYYAERLLFGLRYGTQLFTRCEDSCEMSSHVSLHLRLADSGRSSLPFVCVHGQDKSLEAILRREVGSLVAFTMRCHISTQKKEGFKPLQANNNRPRQTLFIRSVSRHRQKCPIRTEIHSLSILTFPLDV